MQAAGSALLIPSSLALVLRAFPARRCPYAVAIWGASGAAAGALGPTLGAALVEAASWRWVFLLNLPVGIVTVGPRPSGAPRVERPRHAAAGHLRRRADRRGVRRCSSLGIVQGDDWGWTDARTVGALAGGLALLAVFLQHQRRTPAPALDLDLFDSRNYRWANAAMLVFGIAFAAMFFGSILFLTDVWGWSILKAGLAISPGPAVVALLRPVSASSPAASGQRPLLLLGGAGLAAGGAVAPRRPRRARPTTWPTTCPRCSSPASASRSASRSWGAPRPSRSPANRLGVGGAVNQAVRQFGGTLGVAATIALLGAPTGLDRRPRPLRPHLVAHRPRRPRHVAAVAAAAHHAGARPRPASTPRPPRPRPPSPWPTDRTVLCCGMWHRTGSSGRAAVGAAGRDGLVGHEQREGATAPVALLEPHLGTRGLGLGPLVVLLA